jgi:hypothetical protein
VARREPEHRNRMTRFVRRAGNASGVYPSISTVRLV